MNLARMMTDKFFIEGQDGTRSGPFKTKFGGSTLMVFQDDLHVAQGDRIVQPLSGGCERVYIVESSSFTTGSRNIPSHFSIKTSEQAATQEAVIPATRMAQDCRGSQTHLADIDRDGIAASLRRLAQAIELSNFPTEQKNAATAILRALLDNPVVTTVLAGVAKAEQE